MTTEAVSESAPNNREPIASAAHTLGLVLINVGIALWGIAGQMRSTGSLGLAAEHHGVVPLYLSLIAMEWALLYYVSQGARKNVTLFALVGGNGAVCGTCLRTLVSLFLFGWSGKRQLGWSVLSWDRAWRRRLIFCCREE